MTENYPYYISESQIKSLWFQERIFVLISTLMVVITSALPDHFAPVLPPVHPVHHHTPVYKEAPHPYTYKYGVHDDYSGSNFDAGETGDGHGNVEGSYSVLLPDGRVQHVKYHADHHAGYVADVTYEGAAHHPHHAPPAYHH